MILKFEDFIKEGLWSKGVDRSKSGEKRLGDLTPFDNYMKEIEWVDLGNDTCLFAKMDFDMLSYNEIKDIRNHLPEDIYIISKKEVDWLSDNSKRSNVIGENGRCWKCFNDLGNIVFNIENGMGNLSYYFISEHDEPVIGGIIITELPVKMFKTRNNVLDDDKFDKKQFFIKLIKMKQ